MYLKMSISSLFTSISEKCGLHYNTQHRAHHNSVTLLNCLLFYWVKKPLLKFCLAKSKKKINFYVMGIEVGSMADIIMKNIVEDFDM